MCFCEGWYWRGEEYVGSGHMGPLLQPHAPAERWGTNAHRQNSCLWFWFVIFYPKDGFHITVATGGHYITMLLAEYIMWSFALQFLWWKMLWNSSILWQKGIFASSFSYSSPLGEHESLVKSISTGSHITQDWGPVQGLCISLVYSHLSNTQLPFLTSVIHRETHTECINGFPQILTRPEKNYAQLEKGHFL